MKNTKNQSVSDLFNQTQKINQNTIFLMIKTLDIKTKNFEKFLTNKFTGWRYYNHNLGEIFGYRYQANSLVTKR